MRRVPRALWQGGASLSCNRQQCPWRACATWCNNRRLESVLRPGVRSTRGQWLQSCTWKPPVVHRDVASAGSLRSWDCWRVNVLPLWRGAWWPRTARIVQQLQNDLRCLRETLANHLRIIKGTSFWNHQLFRWMHHQAFIQVLPCKSTYGSTVRSCILLHLQDL